jgi:hypothetical protein
LEKKKTISQENFDNAKVKLEKTGSIEVSVFGTSMLPIILPGEKIRLKPIPEKLNVFDIIIFLQQDILVCHFIWHFNRSNKKQERTLITRRYNGLGYDFPVIESKILGIVTNKKMSLFNKVYTTFKFATCRKWFR